MNAQQRDQLEQELLELHFGCHPDPERLRARLHEPEVAALWRHVSSLGRTLASAAKDQPARELPVAGTTPRRSARGLWRLPAWASAAALLITGVIGAVWGYAAWQNRAIRAQHITLTVSGPQANPDVMAATYAVRGRDVDDQPTDGTIRWRVLGTADQVLAEGTTQLQKGDATIEVPAQFAPSNRLLVSLDSKQGARDVSLPLRAAQNLPLVHITSDKPIYRPGESAKVRAIALDRVALSPLPDDLPLRLRVLDPRATVTFEQAVTAQGARHGVIDHTWQIAAEVAGGRFVVQVLGKGDDTPLCELPITVQRFEPPRFEKHLALDQPSYAPGARGAADLAVARLGGGDLTDVPATARIVADGQTVWSGETKLDAHGRAQVQFSLPATTRPGSARLAVMLADGANVETVVASFTVSGGLAQVAAYPEGGDLVAGLESRIYIAARDAMGQPIDARGRLVDQAGTEVTTFTTLHHGMAVCTLTPRAGSRYAVELLGAATARGELPPVRDAGIVLRALDDKIAAGAPLRLRLQGRGTPRVQVGVFCRGVLVGQSETTLEPSAELSIPLPDVVCGVLRITTFARIGADLVPLAERLVQRAAKQRLDVTITPRHAEVTPGAEQTLRIAARDEHGAPVSAVLGLAVIDQSVRALAAEPRVGLADHTLLFADVPDAPTMAFAAADASRVDLLLGTAGWRRFVWRDKLSDDATPQLTAARQREGRVDAPRKASVGDADTQGLWAAGQFARRWSYYTRSAAALGGLLVLVLGLAALLVALARVRGWSTTLPADVAFGALASVLLIAAPVFWLQQPRGSWIADGAMPPPTAATDFALGGSDKLWARAYYEADGADNYFRFSHPANTHDTAGQVDTSPTPAIRQDFTETAHWSPLLITDPRGEAEVTFQVSDRVTTWRIDADAHTPGRVGQASATFVATQPLQLEAKLPIEATEGDQLLIPIAVVSKDPSITSAELKVQTHGSLRQRDGVYQLAELQSGKGRLRLPVSVGTPGDQTNRIEIEGRAGAHRDHIRQDLRVLPRGFPHHRSWSGSLAATTVLDVPMPQQARRPRALLRVFPSPLSTLREGLDGMLQEPHGCFEQASSTNYPNVLVLSYLEATGDVLPTIASRARSVLGKGYDLLVGYECKARGYEWFGADPGHQELTAYGLLEFTDMARVYAVEDSMVERTRAWLLNRRNGQGGFSRPTTNRHAFGSAPAQVSDAYCLWALLYGGSTAADLAPELERARERAQSSTDAYELALLASALREAEDTAAATRTRARLAELQRPDGSLCGTTTSITGSRGDDLAVETTALAVLAWLGDDTHSAAARRALEFVQSKRQARGTFGATQATVLALRALTAYAQAHKPGKSRGELVVTVGDQVVTKLSIAGDEPHAIEVELAQHLREGNNRVGLQRVGDGEPWPYALTLSYHAEQPADDDAAPVALRTSILGEQVREGDLVVVDVELENTTGEGVPMTMAIIGLPAGLELPRHELDTLQGTGHFDFYELNGREVVLYWRGLGPNQTYRLRLATVARIPGISTGPASRAYPYYQPGAVRWNTPLRIDVK